MRSLQIEVVSQGNDTEVGIRARALGTANQVLSGITVAFELVAGSPADASIRVTTPVTPVGDEGAFAIVTFPEGQAEPLLVLVSADAGLGDETRVSRTVNVASPVVQGTDEPTGSTLRLIATSNTLASDADLSSEGITLTAILTDARSNLVTGATILFSACELDAANTCLPEPADPGGTGALQVTRAVTDITGTAEAILTTSGNSRDRRVRITGVARANVAATATFDVTIVGSNITLIGPNRLGNTSSAEYTATLRDSGNFPIGSQPVQFVQAGAGLDIENPAVLRQACRDGAASATSVSTSATGEATFTLANPSADLTLIACALLSSEVSAINVGVAQSSLLAGFASGASASKEVNFGECRAIDLQFTTTDGSPIANQPLTVGITRGAVYSGSTCAAASRVNTVNTNGSGAARVFVDSGESDGAGLSLFRAEHISGASDSVEVEFIATTPFRIDILAEPFAIAPNESAVIRAVVRDAANNFVKNVVVRFRLEDTSGGRLNAPTQVSDSQGRAQVTYTASEAPSSRDSVRVTASLDAFPGVSPSTTELSVGGSALRITLGTGNELFEPNETVYDQPFSVIVTDALGNPAPPETIFRLSVRVLSFSKGFYQFQDPVWVPIYTTVPSCVNEDRNDDGLLQFIIDEDIDNDGNLDIIEVDVDGDGRPDSAEDLDGDGRLDTGEDANFNRLLDPGEDRDGDGALDLTENLDGDTDANGQPNCDIGLDRNRDGRIQTTEAIDIDGDLAIETFVFVDGPSPTTCVFFAEDIAAFNAQVVTADQVQAGTIRSCTTQRGRTPEEAAGDANATPPVDPLTDSSQGSITLSIRTGFADINIGTEDINRNGTFQGFEDLDNDDFFDRVNEDLDNDGKCDFVNEDVDGDGRLDVQEDRDGDGRFDTVFEDDPAFGGNGNLRLDVLEDTNQDGILTPGNVITVPDIVELDDNGSAQFNLTYPQDNANWIDVELRALASVAGSETVEVRRFTLTGIASDFNNEDTAPPGQPSPYGVGFSCFNTD